MRDERLLSRRSGGPWSLTRGFCAKEERTSFTSWVLLESEYEREKKLSTYLRSRGYGSEILGRLECFRDRFRNTRDAKLLQKGCKSIREQTKREKKGQRERERTCSLRLFSSNRCRRASS